VKEYCLFSVLSIAEM